MKITKSADCALRVLIYLASTNEPATMPVLSEKLAIPYNNLSKLIQAMSKAALIQTRQGKNGGIRLLKPAETISLKTVVDLIDGPTRLSDCFHDDGFCALENFCKLQGALKRIQNNIDQMLDSTTISQMI